MRKQLDTAGYRCVQQVMEHGEFAIRGSIIDIYPSGHDLPFRIDLFDDDIDSIRRFSTSFSSLIDIPGVILHGSGRVREKIRRSGQLLAELGEIEGKADEASSAQGEFRSRLKDGQTNLGVHQLR